MSCHGRNRKRQRSPEEPEGSASSNEFKVVMLNGASRKLTGDWVLELKRKSQFFFQKGFLKLVANGKVLDLNGRCDEKLIPGDSITAVVQKPKVVACMSAFALFCVGGDRVVTRVVPGAICVAMDQVSHVPSQWQGK